MIQSHERVNQARIVAPRLILKHYGTIAQRISKLIR